MLVVVEHRDIEFCAQRRLDLEARRGGDVFEIDAAKGRRDRDHRVDEFLRRFGVHFDIEHVDIGEALEQHRLAFHHRLAGERADVAEAEHGRAVGDDRHQVALGGVAIGGLRVDGDGAHRLGHAGRVGQREVLLAGAGLGGLDADLAGLWQRVIVERGAFQIVRHVVGVQLSMVSFVQACIP